MFWGGFQKFKAFPISNFSQIRYKGGGRQISNFSQIQKSPNHPGGEGGGAKKIVDFFHFLGHFLSRRLPSESVKNPMFGIFFHSLCYK